MNWIKKPILYIKKQQPENNKHLYSDITKNTMRVLVLSKTLHYTNQIWISITLEMKTSSLSIKKTAINDTKW